MLPASIQEIILSGRIQPVRVWGNDGPKVLLFHGFPETPDIFDPLASMLVAKGCQVFAPYMPGYGVSTSLVEGESAMHLIDLAAWATSLGHAIRSDQEELVLLGHDWGAAVAYASVAFEPTLYRRFFALAVPPLPVFLKSFLRLPSQWIRSSYMLAFQFRLGIAESALTTRDYAALRALCGKWCGGVPASTAYFRDHDFNDLKGLAGPLAYYRGLFPGLSGSFTKWRESIALAYRSIEVPTDIFVGECDGCIPAPAYKGYSKCFSASSRLTIVPGAGHFLPVDAPQFLAERIISARFSDTR